ncbi:MAG: hypothetical protein R3174_02995 [Gammaproteobacteria bacterium]|nr:hypothetical protein [Gammaproteobacteria bacterium]
MSIRQRTGTRSVMAVLAVLIIAACSKLTPENYAKVKVGMEYAEVVKILGDPGECSAVLNAQNCEWKDGDKEVQIKFVAEKVVFLSSKGL